jgi:ribosomal protein L40E
MGDLGYGTRGPLAGKLKQLANDIQAVYEEFLDAETLYQQGKLSEKEFFKRMGSFMKSFSSLGFLTVKVVLEINNAIGEDKGLKKTEGGTIPSPTFSPDMMGGGMSTPQYTPAYIPAKEETAAKEIAAKPCSKCGAQIPAKAKFCTKCGTPQ